MATAWSLIGSRGYAATSVNLIIAELGISKGSFYHHFESKEAVLDAVVEGITSRERDRLAEDSANANATDRLCNLLASPWRWHEAHSGVSGELFHVLLKPENADLLDRIVCTERRVFRPLVVDVLRQGTREGVFDIPAAEPMVDLLLPLLSDSFIRSARSLLSGARAAQDLVADVELLTLATERLLGAAPGALSAAKPDLQRLLAFGSFLEGAASDALSARNQSPVEGDA